MRLFYEPVALTPYEVKDIARALLAVYQTPQGGRSLPWCQAPSGIRPDVYLSHLRNVDLAEDEADSEINRFGQSSNRHMQRLVLDDDGLYQGKPVALLGEDEMSHHTWRLEDAAQVGQLRQVLNEAAQPTLEPLAARFALTARLVALRRYWSSHHLLWLEGSEVLAAATVRNRAIFCLTQISAARLEKAKIRMVRYDRHLEFNPEPHFALPFWQLLWDYVRRCALTEVHAMLPLSYWTQAVRPHRLSHLPDHGVEVVAMRMLQVLQAAPTPIQQLMDQADCDPEDGLRAVVALLFTRVITFDKTGTPPAGWQPPSQIQPSGLG